MDNYPHGYNDGGEEGPKDTSHKTDIEGQYCDNPHCCYCQGWRLLNRNFDDDRLWDAWEAYFHGRKARS